MVYRLSEVSLSRFVDIKIEITKITADVIMEKFKELTEPRPLPIRSYVYILKHHLFFASGTGLWYKTVP